MGENKSVLFTLGIDASKSIQTMAQLEKSLVKTNMTLGEHFDVFGDWFKIYFIENEGMAFGMKFGGWFGKLLLSLFRPPRNSSTLYVQQSPRPALKCMKQTRTWRQQERKFPFS